MLQFIIQQQKKLIKFIFIGCLVVLVLSTFIVELVFGPSYESATILFVFLAFGYLGGIYFIPLESYFYVHSQVTLIKIKALVAVSTLVLSLTFIYQYGLLGVVIAVLLSKIIGWVAIRFYINKELVKVNS